MLKAVMIASALSLAYQAAAHAQENPKRTKCLQEATAKGLYTDPNSNVRGAGRVNEAMREQRQAFMKECMSRR